MIWFHTSQILLEEFAKAGQMSALQQVPLRDNFSFDILYELVRPLIHLNDEQREAAYILMTWNKVQTSPASSACSMLQRCHSSAACRQLCASRP